MRRFANLLAAAAVLVPTVGAAADRPTGPFSIKPSEVNVPPGTKPGSLRRIIQPFGSWTLICDENLALHRRVCNVSQSIVDAAGQIVFSWSLAANEEGAPVFIVRLPASLAGDRFVQVLLGEKEPLSSGVILSTCDATVCLGYLPVDAQIQRRITARAAVAIKVRIGQSMQTFDATLDGLGPAVASLK